MPLQVGITSARRFAVGFVELLGGALATLWLVGTAIEKAQASGISGALWTPCVAALVALAYVYFGASNLRLAVATRASDVVLGPEGVRVEGGPWDGRPIGRGPLAFQGLSLEKKVENKRQVARLFVREHGQPPLLLATSVHPDETASLEALAETLRALGTAAPPVVSSSSVLRCPACGAPATPAEEPRVVCRACGAAIAIPPELVERVRAATRLWERRPRVEKLVRKLLRQPGARAVNHTAAVVAALVLLSPALALAAGFYQWKTADSVRIVTILGLLELPFFTALGAYLLLRARAVDRAALGLLTLDFSARRDARGELVCHGCGAPLPAAKDAALVSCVYCGADNVLGIDLRQRAASTARDYERLEAALTRRTRQRALWLAGGLASLAVLAHAGSLLVQGFEHNRSTNAMARWMVGAVLGEFHPDRSTHSPAPELRSRRVLVVEEDGEPGEPPRRTALRLVDRARSSTDAGRVLVEEPGLRDPAWLGEDHVLYVGRAPGGRAALRRLPLSGDARPVDLRVADDIERPSASADGALIVFAEKHEGTFYVSLLESGAPRRLMPGRMPHLHPFEPRVVFIGEEGGLPKPFTLDLGEPGAKPEPLLEPNRFRYADPVFSPCGSWVLLSSNAGWDETRTGSELGTLNLIAISMRREGIVPITTGNATARRAAWSTKEMYFQTDGHPDGRVQAYPLRLDGRFTVELYEKRCRGWLQGGASR